MDIKVSTGRNLPGRPVPEPTKETTAPSLKDRICLVTGASSGIGLETAIGLARFGATIVIVCRDRTKGEAAVAGIKVQSGNDSVRLMIADLASQESVRKLASDFKEEFASLHVLVNNAGTFSTKRQVTGDGMEMTFAVNYLARFLLTNLLLDVLKSSAPARIIDVAGAYHRRGRIDFDDLQGEKGYSGARANRHSKLANILFTYELARRLAGTDVTANCLHPGAVATPIIEKDPNYPAFLKVLYKTFKPFLKSPQKGAETTIYLASSPEVDNVTGKYFVDKKQVRSSMESYDESLGERLWETSLRLTKLTNEP